MPTVGTLPAAVTAEITRLGASTGHIMGGTAAVSADMESQLRTAGVTTMTRYPGVDRYDTSRLVAQALSTLGTDNGKTTAFVTTGETGKWADALTASGPAFSAKIPVVLTTGGTLSDSASATFTGEAIKRVVLIGGTSSVTDSVKSDIEALGIEVERIAGATREDTAAQLANYITADADYGFTNSGVVLTGASDFGDSLCAGPYSGKVKNPVLYVDDAISAATSGYLAAHAATIDTARIIGGTSTVPDSAIPELKTAAGDTTPVATPTPTPAPPPPAPEPPAPAPPTVTGNAPATGPAAGGTVITITITGTGFTAGATVTVGGTPATGVTVVSATSITATVPAHALGVVDVAVTSGGTTVTATGGFTYATALTVTNTSAATGSGAGGTTVTITGTGFTAGATVSIGGVPATGVTVVDDTTIIATTAARCPGLVAVTVISGGATAAQTEGFTYTGTVITVTAINPSNGSVNAPVTITGTNFTAPASVTFGGLSSASVTVNSPTSITATLPNASGNVTALVTSGGCTASAGYAYD